MACQAALKIVLVLSLLSQGVAIASQVLLYQYFTNAGFSTGPMIGYFAMIVAGSGLSCLLYFCLIPMSLSNFTVARTPFRILLLFAIMLQFTVATILSVYLRNTNIFQDNNLSLLEQSQNAGLSCDEIAATGLDLCKYKISLRLTQAATALCYGIGFLFTKIIQMCSLRSLKAQPPQTTRAPLV